MAGKLIYRTYDSAWNRTGYSAAPQYAGQQPIRFPADWTPAQCFLAYRTPA